MKHLLLIIGLLVPFHLFAQETAPKRYAVVNSSVNFLREAPSYEAELGTQALMGTIVEIIDSTSYWRQVITPEPYTAWCNALTLIEMSSEQIEVYKSSPKLIITAWHSAVYSSPSSSSVKLTDLLEGNILRLADAKSSKGYTKVLLPDGREGYVPKTDIQDFSRAHARDARDIIEESLRFLGVPYLWGGASPNGVDCSGLVRHVFMMNGILLPRNASAQALEGIEVASAVECYGSPRFSEYFSSLQPADLLFFGSLRPDGTPKVTHVGIYIGDGRMIHSSQIVRINSLISSESDYYENSHKFLFAKRIL